MISFADLAAQCAPGVHLTTISSVVRHESRTNPYAIGINGKVKLPRQPSTKAEAVATAVWLKNNGYNFDGGLGQVNIRNIEWLGMSVSDLFDPCANLRGAARVLTDCYQRATTRFGAGQPALQAALSCYNTGNFSAGFSNGYVQKVAENVTLPVPALAPIAPDTKDPVRLQAVSATGTPVVDKAVPDAPEDEGIADAFDSNRRDAFSSSGTSRITKENKIKNQNFIFD